MRSGRKALAITTSYDGNFDDVGLTVTAYSNIPLSWSAPRPKALYSKHVSTGTQAFGLGS